MGDDILSGQRIPGLLVHLQYTPDRGRRSPELLDGQSGLGFVPDIFHSEMDQVVFNEHRRPFEKFIPEPMHERKNFLAVPGDEGHHDPVGERQEPQDDDWDDDKHPQQDASHSRRFLLLRFCLLCLDIFCFLRFLPQGTFFYSL